MSLLVQVSLSLRPSTFLLPGPWRRGTCKKRLGTPTYNASLWGWEVSTCLSAGRSKENSHLLSQLVAFTMWTLKTALALILVMVPSVSSRGNHFGSQGEMLLPELGGTGVDSRRKKELEGGRERRVRDAIWEAWSPERLRQLRHAKPGRRKTTKHQITT